MKTPITAEQISSSSKKIDLLAEKKLGENYAISDNVNSDYSIVFTKKKNIQDLFATTIFFVYEHRTNAIILEDELSSGVVKWHSEYIIEAIYKKASDADHPNVVMKSYFFDVIERMKSEKAE